MSSASKQRNHDEPEFRISPVQQILAACTGATLTSILVTPLDVIKVRLQSQNHTITKCYLYCNGLMDHFCLCTPDGKLFDRRKHFRGTFDAFIKISKYEGVTSLWSGLSPTLVLAIPATIAYFVTYEQLRIKLKDLYNINRKPGVPREQPMWIPLVSGSSARIISVTIVSPLELVRTKMQSTKLSYLEIGQALRMLIHNNGIPGLWKGVFATLLRDVPFSAIYWSSYETLKDYFTSGDPNMLTFTHSFVSGAISGGLAATITVPFDVVKTRQQIEIGNRVLANESPKVDNTWEIMKNIRSKFGIRGLFAGLVPRLIRVAPACAIMISTFEYSKMTIGRLAQSKKFKTEDEYDNKNDSFNKIKDSNLIELGLNSSRDIL